MSTRKLRDIYRNRIARFPGLWLNLLALALAGTLVFQSYCQEREQQREKSRAARDVLNESFSDYLAGTKALLAVESKIHQDIHRLFHDTPEQALIFHAPENNVETFVRDLNLSSYLIRLSVKNKDQLISEIVHRFEARRYAKSVFLRNYHIYVGWAIMAFLYALLVIFAYFGRAASPETAEPLLNIVDIGILLSLVEYSGGLKSQVRYLLAFSIAVAWFEVVRAYKINGLPTWGKIIIMGLPKSVAGYLPTALYLFALLTGLIWASVDGARESHIGMGRYAIEYSQTVAVLGLLAALIGLAVHLLHNLLIRAAHDNSSTILAR